MTTPKDLAAMGVADYTQPLTEFERRAGVIEPATSYKDLVPPAFPVWTAVIDQDCLCTWDREGEPLTGFTLAGVDRACPFHGHNSPLSVIGGGV